MTTAIEVADVDLFATTGTSPPAPRPAPRIHNGQTADGRLFVTIAEAGALLGLGRSKTHQLVRDGAVPSFRAGRRVLVPIKGLEGIIASAVERGVS